VGTLGKADALGVIEAEDTTTAPIKPIRAARCATRGAIVRGYVRRHAGGPSGDCELAQAGVLGRDTAPMSRIAATLALALFAVGAAGCGGSRTVAASTSPLPGLGGCFTSAPQIRPRSILVACASAEQSIDIVRWSSWSGKVALANGIFLQNLCTPGCASGPFARYRVSVRLFRPRVCANGKNEFTQMTWRPTGTPPKAAMASTVTVKRFPFATGPSCP